MRKARKQTERRERGEEWNDDICENSQNVCFINFSVFDLENKM